MLLKPLLLPALLVASINAQPGIGPWTCGAPGPTEEQIEASRLLSKSERSSMRVTTQREIKVDTYFHILAIAGNRSDDSATEQQVDDQLAVINRGFAPYNISFNLISTTWTKNMSWHSGVDKLEYMKALRQGDYSTLNLYFLDVLPEGMLGFCHVPTMVTPGSDEFYSDGCLIKTVTMPNGSQTGYKSGVTAIHEIGHWFNLFHPFQGGDCEGDGDLVDDTPAQKTASFGCTDEQDKMKDSCPQSPGLDSIHNYMDWNVDHCREEFTPGQVDRMYSSWEKYRRNSTR